MKPARVAIIGGGAAAVGVLHGLERSAIPSEVTLFHPHEPLDSRFLTTVSDDRERSPEYFATLYRHLRQEHGFKFPPPKTHFGAVPHQRPIAGGGRLWDSPALGGLTNFWGGSAVPFSERELNGWPISSADLAEYYEYAAERIGIAGAADKLTPYFGRDYVTRPPVPPVPVAQRLSEEIAPAAGGYRFFAGVNRLAVETRPDHASRCIACGACMTGCGVEAIYNAGTEIERLVQAGRIGKLVRGMVSSIDLAARAVRLKGDSDPQSFDRVYLAAGCIGTTEIVMRSLGLDEGPIMADNSVYTFPILYLGKAIIDPEPRRYFGLSNTAIVCAPQAVDRPSAFIQIYPVFDHLWRYYVPVRFWRVFAPMVARLRGRLLIARVYLHSSQSPTYGFRLRGGSPLEIAPLRPALPMDRSGGLWPAIRSAVTRSGFFIPPLRPVRQGTSSHYAGSLPLGGQITAPDGRIADAVHVCDAAGFVDSPALSPTLTIIANAARIAHRSL